MRKLRIFVFRSNPNKNMLQRLENVSIGIPCKVVSMRGEDNTIQRVKELGMMAGSVVTVVRKAPFGGPIDVELFNTRIAMRMGADVEILVMPA
ncbi:MAG: ferrous iron transport protein A [Ignavibacteria bacterium]|nr:ferrous iron transport protein A [Ignavibacteria bacterium]